MKFSPGLGHSTTDSRTQKSQSEISSFPCEAAVCTCSSQREQQYCRGKSNLFWGPHCHTTGFQKCNTDISGTFSNQLGQTSVSSHRHVYHALVSIKMFRRKWEFTVTHRLYTPSLKLDSVSLASLTKRHFHYSAAEHRGKRGLSSNLNWKVQLLYM